MTAVKLILSALFPVALAIITYWLDKKTKFGKLPFATKQIIIGVIFGISACLATEYGIPTHGVVLNVRGASPLTAGLLFGGPAGIIAGFIGGIYRWFSIYWGIGSYTRVACSLGTILAGFIGAVCKKFMFDNKKASWFYGLFIGMTTEVLHMLLVFITHMDEIAKAFDIVKACAVPMIIANGLSVTAAVLFVTIVGKDKSVKKYQTKQIIQTFSASLFICVIVAFFVTSAFTYILQSRVSQTDVSNSLSMNVEDVNSDIKNASEEHMLEISRTLKHELEREGLDTIPENISESKREELRDYLNSYIDSYRITEINIIDKNGIISLSTNKDFDNFNMGSDPEGQAAEFLCLLDGEDEYVQDFGPTDYDENILRKYAGVSLAHGGFVQIGYDDVSLQEAINQKIEIAAQNRHIGSNGFVFIIDEKNKKIVSAPENTITDEQIESFSESIDNKKDNTVIKAKDDNGDFIYCMQKHTEGYIIIAAIPEIDANFDRNISVYIGVFMQIVVFVTLFVLVYFLIKKTIVDNIHKINTSLAKITGGNLDTKVNVMENEEFASLSNDINATVSTLKQYIAEAEARVDKELEFAKTIQHSSLPSVFPPYPNRKDFDIFASMHTAKEVGGDFYDFYFVGESKLLLLIADVSGKGIPAAMFMMTAKTMIKNLAETGLPVDEVMTQANTKLCEINDAGMFVTVWVGIIDMSTGKINYVCAGHNPPLIKHLNGSFEYLKGKNSFVLAGMEGIKYRSSEMQMLPNDKLFLYTDGVTEATNEKQELYGEDRLLEYLNSRESLDVTETCEGVLESVNSFVGSAPQFDDITMLMFNLNEIFNDDELTLAPTVESIPRVTEYLETRMMQTGVDQKIISKINVIVDEIYSNIAYYSNSLWAKVRFKREPKTITLTFIDNGKEYNPLESDDPDITLSAEERAIGGLGIMMVKKMADDIQYKYESGENTLTIKVLI